MIHKPNCSSNLSCLVVHTDGKCPGYKDCDCFEIKATITAPIHCQSCQCKKEEWKEGDKMWVIETMNYDGWDIIQTIYSIWSPHQLEIIKSNRAFHTKEQAESALEQIKSKLKEIKDNG